MSGSSSVGVTHAGGGGTTTASTSTSLNSSSSNAPSTSASASHAQPTTPTGTPVESHVQVAVRCRPLNEREKAAGRPPVLQCKTNSNEIAVAKRKTYAFDKVYGQYSTQKDVFKATVRPVVDEALGGYNCTVFAYGQTGTGKTHTMQGALAPDDDMAGIIPRCVRYIFDALQASSQEYSVKVSFLQLYNEELKDLLAPEAKKLRLMEDPKRGGIYCQHLLEVTTTTASQVYELLETGVKNRITSETLMNENSSRSHSIFTIRIHSKESNPGGEDLIKTGQLNLVDLAGSECVGRSGARNARAREAGNINQSLLTLGRVITALVDNHPHIPYRDSKLTRLLQESLGGRTKTTIIATLAPCADSIDETLSTLEYAHRAKHIKNKPEVNQKTTKAGLLKEYGNEIETLRSALQAARTKDGIYLPPAQFAEMQERLAGQAVQLSELEDELETRNSACKELEDELARQRDATKELERAKLEAERALATTQQQLASTQQELADTQQQLANTQSELRAFKVNESQLLASGERAATLFRESEHRVALLMDKLARKTRVDEANSSLATAFADTSAAQLVAFETRLAQHEREHEAFARDVASALEQLQAAHATSAEQLTQTLASLEQLVSARGAQETRNATDETDAVTRAGEALQTSVREQDAALQRELERLVALSASHAATLAQELAAAKTQSVDALGDVEAALTQARAEMTQFLAAQSHSLRALQTAIDESVDAQSAQLAAHSKSAVAALRDAHMKQQRELQTLAAQLTVFVDQCAASQSEQLDAHTQLLERHAAAQTAQLRSVRDVAEREVTASVQALASQSSEHETSSSELLRRVADICSAVGDAAARHESQLLASAEEQQRSVQTAASAGSAASASLVTALEQQQCAARTRVDERTAASAAFVNSHESLQRALSGDVEALQSDLSQHVGGTKRKFAAVTQLVDTVARMSAREATQHRDELAAFIKKRKIDEATGSTPTKQSVEFPSFHATHVAAKMTDALTPDAPSLMRTFSAASQASTASSSSSVHSADGDMDESVAATATAQREDASDSSQTEVASGATKSSATAPLSSGGITNRFGARTGAAAATLESSKTKATASAAVAERKLKFGGGKSTSSSSSLQAPRKFR